MSSVTLHYLGALDHVVLQLELMAYRIDISFFSFYFLLADMCFANLLYVRPKKKKKMLYFLLKSYMEYSHSMLLAFTCFALHI